MNCQTLFAAGYLISLREPLVSSLRMGCSYGRGCFLKTDAKAPTLSLSWPGIKLRVHMVQLLVRAVGMAMFMVV